jgi:hypothetical protein
VATALDDGSALYRFRCDEGFGFDSGRKWRLRGEGVSGRGQVGGGPDGGTIYSFSRPLESFIRESLELTSAGALLMVIVGNDVLLEGASGLIYMEESGTSSSIGDETLGWALEGGSGNPNRRSGRR